MKRITWFPQVWLGMTFNWAVLVAYAAKTGTVSLPLFILYAGLIFWTVGYDTIYACQDIEDDAMVGIKSTARKFGGQIRSAVAFCYMFFIGFGIHATSKALELHFPFQGAGWIMKNIFALAIWSPTIVFSILIVGKFKPTDPSRSLKLFKSNWLAAAFLIFCMMVFSYRFEDIWRYVVLTQP